MIDSGQTDLARIQLEFPSSSIEALDKMMEACGLHTKKDLLNNALTLLGWAIREIQEGNIIASIDEKNHNYVELEMPIFTRCRQGLSQGE